LALNKEQVVAPKIEPNHLYEKFKDSAEAISARVYRVTNYPEAALVIAEIVQEKGAKKVAGRLILPGRIPRPG